MLVLSCDHKEKQVVDNIFEVIKVHIKGELKAKIDIFCNTFFRKSNINKVEFG